MSTRTILNDSMEIIIVKPAVVRFLHLSVLVTTFFKQMKTVFKVGMEVYDQVLEPNKKGTIVEIKEGCLIAFPVSVQFENCTDIRSYTLDGRYNRNGEQTLSTKPYKVVFDGFEQKAPVPTYEDAEEWIRREYAKGNNYLMLKDTFEALRKLTILREYYNKGWQPDWSKKNSMHFCIRVRNNKITTDNNSDINEFNTVLVFRDYTIRDKFLEEQRKLLEIAKPLL